MITRAKLVTFTATDECGNTATCQATIIIRDNEVFIENCPTQDLEISCTDDISTEISNWLTAMENAVKTAAENAEGCDGIGEITVTNDYDGIPPTAVCLNDNTGKLVTFTATDECGNTATCQATIIIRDNEVFMETCPANDLIINCSDNIENEINNWLTSTFRSY